MFKKQNLNNTTIPDVNNIFLNIRMVFIISKSFLTYCVRVHRCHIFLSYTDLKRESLSVGCVRLNLMVSPCIIHIPKMTEMYP